VSALSACADSTSTDSTSTDSTSPDEPAIGDGAPLFPDVLDASAVQADAGTWTFEVTISSPYDSPDRYADAWRVLGPNGEELAIRVLTHDHASEQPFTRRLTDVVVPDDVGIVIIEGRDQVSGWGGDTFELTLDR